MGTKGPSLSSYFARWIQDGRPRPPVGLPRSPSTAHESLKVLCRGRMCWWVWKNCCLQAKVFSRSEDTLRSSGLFFLCPLIYFCCLSTIINCLHSFFFYPCFRHYWVASIPVSMGCVRLPGLHWESRLGSVTAEVYFSRFWRLERWDQGQLCWSRSLASRRPSLPYVFTGPALRVGVPGLSSSVLSAMLDLGRPSRAMLRYLLS